MCLHLPNMFASSLVYLHLLVCKEILHLSVNSRAVKCRVERAACHLRALCDWLGQQYKMMCWWDSASASQPSLKKNHRRSTPAEQVQWESLFVSTDFIWYTSNKQTKVCLFDVYLLFISLLVSFVLVFYGLASLLCFYVTSFFRTTSSL